MLQNSQSSRAVIGKRRDSGFSPTAEGSFIMENMRTLADGSAVLREGYSYRCTLPAGVRALLEGTGSDAGKVYAVAGNGFYLIDPAAGSYTLLATVGTATGDAALFRCCGKVYILDGGELYGFDGESGISVERGYVPLYGKGWDPLCLGRVNEPMNLLTRKIRINYRISDPTFRLVAGLTLASVDSFELNGKLLTSEDAVSWSLDAGGGFITTSELDAGDSVTICATVSEEISDASEITACTAASSFGEGGTTRICCFDGLDPATVFVSEPVDNERLSASRRASASAGQLYFPTDGTITAGDGGCSVTALCRCGGDILLFTEEETYRLVCGSSRTPSADLIDGSSGVSSRGCAAGLSGGSIGVFGGDIYYRKAAMSASGRNKELISSDAADSYDVGAISNVLADNPRNEVWFCDPDDKRGRVLILNTENRSCYCFADLYADRLFLAGGRVCFMRGNDLYRFDPALVFDYESDEGSGGRPEPIRGFIESPFFDFGLPGRSKRIQYVSLDVQDGDAELTLIADTGKTISVGFRSGRCTEKTCLSGKRTTLAARGNAGAFRSVKYRISTADTRRPLICGVTLAVRK